MTQAKVAIYGTGSFAKRMTKVLNSFRIDIKCYLDSYSSGYFEKAAVLKFSDLPEDQKFDYVLIAVSSESIAISIMRVLQADSRVNAIICPLVEPHYFIATLETLLGQQGITALSLLAEGQRKKKLVCSHSSELSLTKIIPQDYGSHGIIPVVTVICIAFNHRDYIEKALTGILAQQTDFKIEILVHDDASTDGTRQIIEVFAQQFPGQIIPILQNQNQYSRGLHPSVIVEGLVRGEYIAFCEADDYWINVNKLQKQVDSLRRNPHLAMCFHNAFVIDSSTGRDWLYNAKTLQDESVPLVEIISRERFLVPTASMLVSRGAYHDAIAFIKRYKPTVGDVVFNIVASYPNGAYKLDDAMSTYRYLSKGSWTEAQKSDPKKRVELLKLIQLFLAFAEVFDSERFALVNYAKKLYRSVKNSISNDEALYRHFIEGFTLAEISLLEEV